MSPATTSKSEIHDFVLSSAVAPNTRAAYAKGWAYYTAYCKRERIADPLSASPEVVARFLLDCATQPRSARGPLSMNTVFLYSSAIARRFTDAERA